MPLRLLEMLDALGEDALLETFMSFVPLRSARVMACCCNSLATVTRAHFSSQTFSVSAADASLDNAQFVASMRHPTLRVLENGSVTVLELSRYRSLPRLKVGAMGVVTALYFGAAIVDCDCVLRLSDGITCKSLQPLRERPQLTLVTRPSHYSESQRVLAASDLAALLGTLALNPQLTRLDLSSSLDRDCGRMLSELIINLSSKCKFNLDHNNFSEEGWCELFDALRNNPHSKVPVLNLTNCRLHETAGDDALWRWHQYPSLSPKVAKSVASYVAVSSNLIELALPPFEHGMASWDETAANALQQAARSNKGTTLERIYVDGRAIWGSWDK